MKEQASNFVNQYGGVNSGKEGGKRRANRKPNLQVRRTLRVRIKKSKPILGIAIEGGFNVSGQLLPRIVCVHVSRFDNIFLSVQNNLIFSGADLSVFQVCSCVVGAFVFVA